MNDEELTIFALKAFGEAPPGFSPLTDDGDALRLAVRLGMYINIYVHPKMNQTHVGVASIFLVSDQHNDDPYAATRRAIVRAAAEIGKAMP